MDTIVHSDESAVTRRLGELGLTQEILTNAVIAAYQAWSNCTDFDPSMYRGLTIWAVAVRHLRLGLVPEKWQAKNEANYSITISPDGRIAIAVATGDEGTGIAQGFPTTQSSKGPRTMDALAANNRQLGFEFRFPDGNTPPLLDPATFGERATWLLLIHRSNKELRAELSHPLGFDNNLRVSGWKERLLLPPIDIEQLASFQPGERKQPIDIPVRRKA